MGNVRVMEEKNFFVNICLSGFSFHFTPYETSALGTNRKRVEHVSAYDHKLRESHDDYHSGYNYNYYYIYYYYYYYYCSVAAARDPSRRPPPPLNRTPSASRNDVVLASAAEPAGNVGSSVRLDRSSSACRPRSFVAAVAAAAAALGFTRYYGIRRRTGSLNKRHDDGPPRVLFDFSFLFSPKKRLPTACVFV